SPVNAPARTPCAWTTSVSATAARSARTAERSRPGLTEAEIGTGRKYAPTLLKPKCCSVCSGPATVTWWPRSTSPAARSCTCAPMPPVLVPSTSAIRSLIDRPWPGSSTAPGLGPAPHAHQQRPQVAVVEGEEHGGVHAERDQPAQQRGEQRQ